MKSIRILFLLFVSVSVGCSNSYYVSSDGNDANSGKSPEHPWKTLTKVNEHTFSPGDKIFFNRGDQWFGQLIPQSGSNSGHITYGAYGKGDKPILHMSVEVTDWIEESPKIWRSVGQGTYGPEILQNASFVSNTDNWSIWHSEKADATISRDDTEFFSSPAGLKIVCVKSGDAASDIQLRTGRQLKVEAGKTYEFSFYAKSTQAFNAEEIRHMGGSIGPVSFNTRWTKIYLQFTASSTTDNGNIVMSLGRYFPAGSSLYIDNVSFKEFEYKPLMDVAFLIFNNKDSIGVKVWKNEDLKQPGQFVFDTDGQCIKLYSNGNPDTCYSDIKCILTKHIVNETDKSYIIYENLAIKYGGAHGIGGGNTHHIIVRDCDFAYIGGGKQTRTVRYGNGVEFWAGAQDNLVERCRLWEIYDAALTNQSTTECIEENIIYRNNIIWNCEYSFEFFNYPAKSVTKNIQFINNTCFNAGYGLKQSQRIYSQRRNPTGRHVCIWSTPFNASDFIIENNIFYKASEYPLYLPKGNLLPFKIDYNCWVQDSGKFANLEIRKYSAGEFSSYKKETSLDANSIAEDPLVIDAATNNFNLKGNSPCINRGNPKAPFDKDGTITDIGALPFIKP
jgi:hypothetical protein